MMKTFVRNLAKAIRRTLYTSTAVVLLLGCSGNPADPSGLTSKPAQRLVAIGDIHADLDAARDAFRLAGGIDQYDNWIGGDLVIVQLGDIIGRSFDDLEVLDFIFELREKAESAGGKVHVLIGNHEVFGARLETRWVHPDAFAAFDGVPGLDLDNAHLAHLPADQRARSAALMPGGLYARRLADFPAVLRLGNTVFVHGGVNPTWATYGIDRINEDVQKWFAGETEEPAATLGYVFGRDDDGVMWSRHFSKNVDEEDCEMLQESLSILGAERMIVAHTVQESITARCDEKVWAIDVGMSRYYDGDLQVLEIIDDEIISIIRSSK
jgi:Calcineurin-like phosphoesterase